MNILVLFRPVCKSKKILVYITESTMLRCMIAISSVARAYVHKAIAEIRVISNVILKIIASESNWACDCQMLRYRLVLVNIASHDHWPIRTMKTEELDFHVHHPLWEESLHLLPFGLSHRRKVGKGLVFLCVGYIYLSCSRGFCYVEGS